jgi:phosphomannomutase
MSAMNDPEVKELVDKWNGRHDMAKEQFENKFQTMTKEQLFKTFKNQMSCDDSATIIGKLGLGPQSFNEFSVSAFAQEFSNKFNDKILIAFGTNTNKLKSYAYLCVSGIGGNARLIDEVIPQPLVSFVILNKDIFEYGLYLKHLSREECAIVCYDSKGRKMSKSKVIQIQYLDTNSGVKAEHRKTSDKLILKNKECQQYKETYATIVSNLVYFSDKELLQNTDIKFIHTSLNGCANKLFQKCVTLSGFLHFDYVEEEQKPLNLAKAKFDGKRIEYLLKAIPLAEAKDAPIIIAHNSYGTRVLVAEREQTKNDYKDFSDEEIAILLSWWAFTVYKLNSEYEKKTNDKSPETAKTILFDCGSDQDLLHKMLTKEGFHVRHCSQTNEVIESIAKLDYSSPPVKTLFASGKTDYFICNPEVVTDWDGIGAALHIAQLAVYLKAVHRYSLRKHLESLQNIYK